MKIFCQVAAQRFGLPAADYSKTRLYKITFSAKWPSLFRAEGGQVEPVSGRFCKTVMNFIIAAYKVTYQIPGSSLFVRLAYA